MIDLPNSAKPNFPSPPCRFANVDFPADSACSGHRTRANIDPGQNRVQDFAERDFGDQRSMPARNGGKRQRSRIPSACSLSDRSRCDSAHGHARRRTASGISSGLGRAAPCGPPAARCVACRPRAARSVRQAVPPGLSGPRALAAPPRSGRRDFPDRNRQGHARP